MITLTTYKSRRQCASVSIEHDLDCPVCENSVNVPFEIEFQNDDDARAFAELILKSEHNYGELKEVVK